MPLAVFDRTGHIALWTWLAREASRLREPGARSQLAKRAWPGWEDRLAAPHDCFACEAVHSLRMPSNSCRGLCPLVWIAPDGRPVGACMLFGSPYDMWKELLSLRVELLPPRWWAKLAKYARRIAHAPLSPLWEDMIARKCAMVI